MIGNIVYSKCGHDKGDIFVVINEDNLYYYLVDGKLRLVNRPKKKNFKHVQRTNYVCNELIEKIGDNKCMDSDIRKAIKRYEERE